MPRDTNISCVAVWACVCVCVRMRVACIVSLCLAVWNICMRTVSVCARVGVCVCVCIVDFIVPYCLFCFISSLFFIFASIYKTQFRRISDLIKTVSCVRDVPRRSRRAWCASLFVVVCGICFLFFLSLNSFYLLASVRTLTCRRRNLNTTAWEDFFVRLFDWRSGGCKWGVQWKRLNPLN